MKITEEVYAKSDKYLSEITQGTRCATSCIDLDPPSIEAVEGIYFDFNVFLRISFPDNGKKYYVSVIDTFKDILLDKVVIDETREYASKYTKYIPYKFTIKDENDECIFEHTLDLHNQEVVIIGSKAIGDSIAWMNSVDAFQKKHECKCIYLISPSMLSIFEKQYPNIIFDTNDNIDKYKPYATYSLGQTFRCYDNVFINYHNRGLHHIASDFLGVETTEEPPTVDLSAKRKITGKYVVVCSSASGLQKLWHNIFGWVRVINFLKHHGYRVICIDQCPVTPNGVTWQSLPFGVEYDYVGNFPLQERIDIIKDADFFIGHASGMSWLAWCCRVPVVMISGFSHPVSEFYTPYRVFSDYVCNSCWNDQAVNSLNTGVPSNCPRFHGTERQWECSRTISSNYVINVIKTIPTFKERREHTSDEVVSIYPNIPHGNYFGYDFSKELVNKVNCTQINIEGDD